MVSFKTIIPLAVGELQMTKQEIVDVVSEATGLTKVETETVMNGVMMTIINALTENRRVELRGFGTFGVKHRLPKKARNPGTGEPVYLPERYVPTFKPAKQMRLRVNNSLKKNI